jgi:hypothetical protein
VLKYDVIVYNDNRAAIDIVNAGKFSQKTRHMARSAILFINRSRMVCSRLSGKAPKSSEQTC